MSNLLSANIDSGLMHSIGLGYHKDLQIRAAFMEVLTKILQQGQKLQRLTIRLFFDVLRNAQILGTYLLYMV